MGREEEMYSKQSENRSGQNRKQSRAAQASQIDSIMADLERTRLGDIAALARLTQMLKRAVADERLALNELDKEEQRLNEPKEKQSRVLSR